MKIQANSLSKNFERDDRSYVEALKDITLSIDSGEIICILGRSGCGKSTFLNITAGLISQTSGSISIFGQSPHEAKNNITYIQQKPFLLPYRNVFANAALGLELKNELNEESITKLEEFLIFLGFKDFYSHYPSELSGGMQQRLAFARTFSIKASVVLCDEPFSSLDFDTRVELENFFWVTVKQKEQTSIFVTHQIDSAVAIADRIVIFTPRPGRISQIISLDDTLKLLPPNKRRDSDKFSNYYSSVWKALQDSNKHIYEQI